MYKPEPLPGAPPCKVVIHAAPGTDPAVLQRAYAQLLAPIGHFYNKSRQAQQIAGLPQLGRQQKLPGVQLNYVNNNGLETVHITLEVPQPRGGGSTPPPPPPEPWDTILVELVIEDMADPVGTPMVAAYVVPEKPGETDYAASDGTTSGGALSFATADEDLIGTQTGATTWYGSLKIDITKLRGESALEVDIYAGVAKIPSFINTGPYAFRLRACTVAPDDPGDFQFTLKVLGDYVIDIPGGTDEQYERLYAEFPEVRAYRRAAPGEFTLDNDTGIISTSLIDAVGAARIRSYFAQFGEEGFAIDRTQWPGGSDGSYRIVTSAGTTHQNTDPLGPVEPGLPDPVYANVRLSGTDSIVYWMPLFEDPQNRDHAAHLKTLFFRHGDPLTVVAKIETPEADSYRWEDQAIYPRRASMNEVRADVKVRAVRIPIGSGTANHFGLIKIGTFTFDLDHAVAKWKPA